MKQEEQIIRTEYSELMLSLIHIWHRNTLVYRLERLEKVIGLDIRKFDDAMTFKIAMMVISHMQYVKNSENALN